MNISTPTRVAAFAAGLAVVFVAGWGLGRGVGPDDPDPRSHDMADMDHAHTNGHDKHADKHAGNHGSEHGDGHGPGGGLGLTAAEDGYALALADARLAPGRQVLRFTITGPDGRPVTAYDELHERDLHLIVVRHDLTGFQHVHPTLAADGTWSVPVRLSAGAWRVIADLVPTGAEQTTLGTDLTVGTATPSVPLGPGTRAAAVDGYDVTLSGDLAAGSESMLHLRIQRGGRPVTDLQPYLGAFGHLVMLREGDQAYVHVHPMEGPSGPELMFMAEAPSAGRYRLFLDFRHAGTVRTAAFTVTVR